ncbi:MAG: preprotein translocase subunit SecE [Desulfosalsimonadaceae bacterium]
MARIQKKKPAAQKKKSRTKEPGGPEETVSSNGPAPVQSKAAGAGGAEASKEKKQKRNSTAKSTTSGGQSFILRLVDRYFGNWIQFLREVKIELSRVTWPSRKQTLGSTAVVLVFVFVVAIFLGLVDLALSSLVRLII